MRYLVLFFCCYIEPSYAGPNIPIGNTLCTVVGWMGGNLGKGLEACFVSILGVGALLGKVSWGTAMVEGIGSAAMIEAASIVDHMGAGAPAGCPTA